MCDKQLNFEQCGLCMDRLLFHSLLHTYIRNFIKYMGYDSYRKVDEWTKYAISISMHLLLHSLVHMALSIACVLIQTNNDNRESKSEIRLYSSLKVRNP